MRRITLVFLISFFALHSFAQGMYGFEGGLGKATAGKNYTTPAFSSYLLKCFSRSFYLGGALTYQRYSFLDKYAGSSLSPAYSNIISIRNKSSYVLLSPKADFGIGYRKYVHVYASFGLGMLLGGKQTANISGTYQAAPPATTGTDTSSISTSGNLPILISRYNMGASWRIPTMRYWNIIISTEYNIIPTNLTIHGPALKTNYFCFTVGIMHKYPLVFVEY